MDFYVLDCIVSPLKEPLQIYTNGEINQSIRGGHVPIISYNTCRPMIGQGAVDPNWPIYIYIYIYKQLNKIEMTTEWYSMEEIKGEIDSEGMEFENVNSS